MGMERAMWDSSKYVIKKVLVSVAEEEFSVKWAYGSSHKVPFAMSKKDGISVLSSLAEAALRK